MRATPRCAYCDAELQGGRRDRKYCNDSCRGLHHYHRTADKLPARVPQTKATPSKSRKLRELAEIQAERTRLGLPQVQLEPWLCSLATIHAVRQKLAELEARHAKLAPPSLRHSQPMAVGAYRADAHPSANRIGIGSVRIGGETTVCLVLGILKSR